MATALVDSNVVIAYASRRDNDHEIAVEILSGIDHGELPAGRLTNYVVSETLGFLNERRGHNVTVDLYGRLKSGSEFEVVHCTRNDFATAESIFERWPQLSFVDATMVSYARRTEIEYIYSFDDDFDGVDGITRLESASNPFRE